jgi:hypothetical protein
VRRTRNLSCSCAKLSVRPAFEVIASIGRRLPGDPTSATPPRKLLSSFMAASGIAALVANPQCQNPIRDFGEKSFKKISSEIKKMNGFYGKRIGKSSPFGNAK